MRRKQQQNRFKIAGVGVAAVLVVVLVLVIVKLTGNDDGKAKAQPKGTALSALVKDATTVPAATLDSVGAGSLKAGAIKPITGAAAYTKDGKPSVLYVGGEFCPYCAAERWPMVVALSRFGTFSGLQTTTSSSKDVFPDTATFTFLKAKYTSKYLAFEPVEAFDRDSKNLQKPTDAQQKVISTWDREKYTGGSDSAIPFLYYGGKFVSSGATYDPGVLKGKSPSQIAAALQKPSGAVSEGVNSTANVMTAAICAMTKNQPAAVCNAAGVKAGAGKLG